MTRVHHAVRGAAAAHEAPAHGRRLRIGESDWRRFRLLPGMVNVHEQTAMAETNPDAVTLSTLHDDLGQGFAEMRAGFTDLETTLVVGFRSLPTRESSEEMVRLLREGNRLQEERFTQPDVRIREQHLETQQVLHAVAVGQRTLTAEIRALVARLDALIDWRDGGRTA